METKRFIYKICFNAAEIKKTVGDLIIMKTGIGQFLCRPNVYSIWTGFIVHFM